MALTSFSILLIICLIATVNTDVRDGQNFFPSVESFKEYISNMIKDQSSKIQTLLKKVQTNAQSVLNNIESIKQDKTKINSPKSARELEDSIKIDDNQVESNIVAVDTTDTNEVSRSFNNHYGTTSYGASANANHGAATYHHHSIGFDPVNIVVSMSLLSFLLQALQGLLGRTRLPTPVVEARNLNSIPILDPRKFEDTKDTDKYYLKRKYFKKYF